MFFISEKPISKEWDAFLNKCMDEGARPTNFTPCTCMLGGVRIWIANYPYSFGNPYEDKRLPEMYPTKPTRKRLQSYVMGAAVEGADKRYEASKKRKKKKK